MSIASGSARHFANTDAGIGEWLGVRESPPIDEKIQCLRGMMKRRHQLIGQRVEEHNRLEKGTDKAVMVSLNRIAHRGTLWSEKYTPAQ